MSLLTLLRSWWNFHHIGHHWQCEELGPSNGESRPYCQRLKGHSGACRYWSEP